MPVTSMMRIAPLFLLAFLLATATEAAVVRVPDDHARVTDALVAASPGDTVQVGAGLYSPGANGEAFPLFLGKNDLCLLGAGAAVCTLDAGGAGSVIVTTAASGGRISGFTITGGSAFSGGGIRVATGEGPEIDHNVLWSNAAQTSGSGIQVDGFTAPWIHHNVLWENHDVDVEAEGDPHGIQFATHAEGTVEHNLVGRGDSNGLLTASGSHPVVRNNIFFENGIPALRGRGICHFGDSTTVIAHNLLHGNVIAALLVGGMPPVNVSGADANGLSPTDGIYENLDGDPLFLNAEASDWRLAPQSPAIDAGDPLSPPDPDGTTADVGPFYHDQEAGGVPDADPSVRALISFPNPFRAGTTLLFTTRTAGRVVVGVHDVEGRRVVDLMDAHREPGTHTIAWDGRVTSGRRAAPGVYYLKLDAGRGKDARKVVLLP